MIITIRICVATPNCTRVAHCKLFAIPLTRVFLNHAKQVGRTQGSVPLDLTGGPTCSLPGSRFTLRSPTEALGMGYFDLIFQ